MKTGTDTKSRSKKKGSREKETARSLALSALLKIEDGVYTKDAMQEVLSKEQLTGADRGLFVMLCEGVTARRITLDAAIDLVAKTKTAKMKPVIRNILRMGAFQLLFLDRIPDAAVVDESVKLCIRRGFAPLKGFVNGVLRELIRRRDAGTWFPEGGEDAAALSIRYSMPEFLVKKWIAWYGKDACAQIFESFLNGKHIFIEDGDGIGDLIMVTPTLRKIKELYPEAILTFATFGKCLEIVSRLPYIDYSYYITVLLYLFFGFKSRI